MKKATLGQAAKILSVFEETPTEQVQAIITSGLLADLRDANVAEVNRDEARRVFGLKPLSPPLLKLIGTVELPALPRFVAAEKFVVNTGPKAPMKISYIGDNFKNWFLGKIEEPVVETTLRYAKSSRSEVDGPILAELGESAETTLSQIYAFIERQPNGESGPLLVNGYANIFYVRDANGGLRAVRVGWDGDGWDVDAHSVSDPLGWHDGRRVFSCNSCDLEA